MSNTSVAPHALEVRSGDLGKPLRRFIVVPMPLPAPQPEPVEEPRAPVPEIIEAPELEPA